MKAPRLCDCPEPQAAYEHWPDDMHTHESCPVFHAGVMCALPKEQPELPLNLL